MPVPRDLLEAPPDRLDAILEGLFTVLLIFAPLALGAVEAWSELVVIALAGAMALCLGLKFLLSREYRPVFSWAYLPLGLFLLFALFQLLPLPESLLGLISPHTAELKHELLSDLPGALDSLTITFYADGTLHDLRLALAIAAIFLVAAHIYRRPESLRRLLITVISIGTALAILSIAQTISGTDSIYWLIQSPHEIVRGSTFINKNNFCLFINLSLGAALALLLIEIQRNLAGTQKTLPAVLDWITGPRARGLWLLVLAMLVCMAAVFLSLSRGGMIALLVSLIVIALIMAKRKHLDGHAWIMASLALGAFVCVLFLGFDAVYDRLASLEKEAAYESRWDIVKSVAAAWTHFPLVGTGFGTHEVVYPMFDQSTSSVLFAFAENEYVQMAEEMGLIGLILILAFGIAILRAWRHCLRQGGLSSALAYGLGFGILAVAIQSITDFGLHIPANACLTATFCGVLIARTHEIRRTDAAPGPASAPRNPRRLLGSMTLTFTLTGFGWAMIAGENARAAESHWNEVERIEEWLSSRNWIASNTAFADLISRAESAVEKRPGKIHYRYLRSVYRWRGISRVVDPETGQLRLGPQAGAYIQAIIAELHAARALCPTYGPVYCMAGQLELFSSDDPASLEAGARHIRKGYELAPNHPAVCQAAGLLDVVEDRPEEGLAKLLQAVKLESGLFRIISEQLIDRFHQPRLAMELARENSGHLKYLSDVFLRRHQEFGDLAREAQSLEIVQLNIKRNTTEITAHELARLAWLYMQHGEHHLAEGCYLEALRKMNANVKWRMELAELYVLMRRFADALAQVEICLRIKKGYPPAIRLQRELELRNR